MSRDPSAQQLAAVSQLMKDTTTYLDDLRLIPRSHSLSDIVLLALLSKSITVTDAVVCLLTNGFTEEAMGLSRTCMEIQLVVRYLTNKETDKRCSRFMHYAAKDKIEYFRLSRKHYPEAALKERSDQKELEKLASAYRSPSKWSEDPDGLKGMAAEPPTVQDGTETDEVFNYEVSYKMASAFVHGTVGSLDKHGTSPGNYYKIHPGKGKSTWGGSALNSSFLSVNLNMCRIFAFMNMDANAGLQERFVEVGHMDDSDKR